MDGTEGGTGLSWEKIEENWKYTHLLELEHAEKNVENTYLLGTLLSIKCASNASQTLKLFPSKNAKTPTNMAMRNRFMPAPLPYDKIFMFGDLCEDGKCFVVISDTTKIAAELFFTTPNPQIGDVFALLEPRKIDRLLAEDDLPIVDFGKSFMKIAQGTRRIAEVPFSIPLAGKTKWFLYHGLTDVSFQYVELKTATCGGRLCDRQQKDISRICGCVHAKMGSSHTLVMQGNVEVETAEGLVTCDEFRSLRVTNLLFDGITMTARAKEQEKYETCLLYTSPSPRDQRGSRMPSSA